MLEKKLERELFVQELKNIILKKNLKDKKIIVFVNLKPRLMKGIESQGMLLAAVSDDHSEVVLICS